MENRGRLNTGIGTKFKKRRKKLRRLQEVQEHLIRTEIKGERKCKGE